MVQTQADRVSFTTEIHRVISMMNEAVRCVITELDNPERRGGYFCLVAKDNNSTALPTLILGVGTVPAEKGPKYMEFAQEKARRLAEHPVDVSSWQSRNPDKNQRGGAIVAGTYILSFSGLPEYGDEAAMLLVAVGIGLLTKEEALTIAEHSNNVFFGITLTKLNWDKAIAVE